MPNTIDRTFVSQIKLGNEIHLIQVKTLTIDPNEGSDSLDARIREIIQKVIGQTDYTLSQNKNITIDLTKNDVFYSFSNRNIVKYEPDNLPKDVSKTVLAITELKNRVLPKRNRTFQEIKNNLLQKWPGQVPIISFFWKYAIYPLSLLARWVYPGKIFDTTSLKTDPHGRFALEDSLTEVIDVLESSSDTGSKEAAEAFKKGIQFAQNWRTQNPQVQQQLISDLTDQFFRELKPSDKAKNLNVIPGGYWEDAHSFNPIMWSFYVNTSGHLCVSEMTYGSEGIQSYSFGANPDREKIKQLLFNLLILSTPKQELHNLQNSHLFGSSYLQFISRMGPQNPHLDEEHRGGPNNEINSVTYENFKENLYLHAGATLIVHTEEQSRGTRRTMSQDPLKLIQETLRNQFQDASFADKALFSLHILNNRLAKVLPALPTMSKEEKKEWIQRLDQDYQSLIRQLEKSQYKTDLIHTFETFGTHLKYLQKAVQDSEFLNLQSQQERMQNLDHVQSSPYILSVPTQLNPITERGQTVAPCCLNESHHALLNKLRIAFIENKAEAIPTVVSTLKSLVTTVNQFINDKHYQTALELSRLIMPLIPESSENPAELTGFWRTLTTLDAVQDPLLNNQNIRERSNQIKTFSDEIGKLSQYFWEIKVKSGEIRLKPDEWVNMINMEAALLQLISARKSILKRHPTQDLQTEENYFLAIADIFKIIDYTYRQDILKITEENYLRISENPVVANRLHRLMKYFQAIQPRMGYGVDVYNKFHGNCRVYDEQEYCRRILQLSRNGAPVTEEEVETLWKDYCSRHTDPNRVSIPSQFKDICRHQIIFRTFIHPKSALTPLSAAIRNISNFVTREISYNLGLQTRERQTENDFSEAMRKIQSYDRLEIVTFKATHGYYFGVNGFDVVFRTENIFLSYSYEHFTNQDLLGNLYNFAHNFSADISEAQLLQDIFATDSQHPIEDHLLGASSYANMSMIQMINAMRRQIGTGQKADDVIVSNGCSGQSLHEVFDSLLQRPWILDAGPNSQKKLYKSLFSLDVIRAAITDTPEYFISHGPILKQLINKFINEKKSIPLTFTLYLAQTVAHHISLSLNRCTDPLTKATLERMLEVWPNRECILNGETYFSHAFKLWSEEENLQDKIDSASHLVSLFSNDGRMPANIPELQNNKILSQLLQMGSLLELTKTEATLPIIAIQATLWLREYFIPHLKRTGTETLGTILDSLVESRSGDISKSIPWTQSSEGVWEKEGTLVDLASMQILRYNGQELQGLEIYLPEEVMLNSDYKLLFGTKKYKALVCPGAHSGEFIYRFKDSLGSNLRILLSRTNHTVIIEKEFVENDNNVEERKWRRFTRAELIHQRRETALTTFRTYFRFIPGLLIRNQQEENSNTIDSCSGIEQQLLTNGAWIDLNHPSTGVCFLGQSSQNDRTLTKFNLAFDSSGRLASVRSIDGMEVVNDAQLSQTLACLPKDQIIFLKTPGANEVSQIRFLNQTVYLARNAANRWILRGNDQLKGAEWVMGEERGNFTNTLLRGLGLHVEHIGFTVRKEDTTYLLVWPQAVKTLRAHKVRVVEFERHYHLNPPLKITISEGGEITSSAGGYLELAYQFAIKHLYAKAAYYIEQARQGKIETKKELRLIRIIERHFKTLPVTSARSALVRLKALLEIRQIMSEQNQRVSTPRWAKFLASAEEIQSVYTLYQTFLQRSPFPNKANYFNDNERDISLNGEELEELRHINNESLSFAVSELARDLRSIRFDFPSIPEIEFILPFLLMDMQRPSTPPLLENIRLSEAWVIERFFEVYNFIITNEITPHQLQPLFGHIQGLDQLAISEKLEILDQRTISADAFEKIKILRLDVARRILLAVASKNMPPRTAQRSPLPLNNLIAMKNQIPQGILSASWRGSIAMLKLLRASRLREASTKYLANTAEGLFVASLISLIQELNHCGLKGHQITLAGYMPNAENNAHPLPHNPLNRTGIKLDKFKKALLDDPNLFGFVETPRIENLLQNELGTYIRDLERQGAISTQKLVELFEGRANINLIQVLRANENKRRIEALEKCLAQRRFIFPPFDEHDAQVRLLDVPEPLREPLIAGSPPDEEFLQLWTASPSVNHRDHIQEMVREFSTILQDGPDSLENTANRKLLAGINAAQTNLLELVDTKFTIDPSRLSSIEEAISAKRRNCISRMRELRGNIIQYVKDHPENLPNEIKKALRHIEEIGEDGLLYSLKKAYQSLNLNDPPLVEMLTRYLLEKVAVVILAKEVKKQIKALRTLQRKGITSNSNEWISISTRMRELIVNSLSYKRYLTAEGYLKSPRLYRKILVAEATMGIVLTDLQINLIIQIKKNPTSWYELPPGYGKTSVILPIVTNLLCEEGLFPTICGQDDLLQQILDSLDGSTRELTQQAGVKFSYHINDPISPIILQERYIRLLELHNHSGYPITSISSLIAIDQKLQLLGIELSETIQAITAAPQPPQDVVRRLAEDKKLKELHEKIYWLGKIKEKLRHIFIDEADAGLDVICENNVGRNGITGFESEIKMTIQHLMRVANTSTNSEVIKLREAIYLNQQASLPPIQENLIPELVRALLNDPEYRRYLGVDHDLNHLIPHLTTVFETRPADGPPLPLDLVKKLGALKHIVQITFPTTLIQNPGIEVGVKNSDGFQIGPQLSGREKSGVVFADPFDKVINHTFFYSIRLPSSAIIRKGLRQIREQYREVYDRWLRMAGRTELFTFLNQRENFQLRMEFLDLAIYEQNKIRRFKSQMVFNVQDVCYQRSVGGMTGTLDQDSLPNGTQDSSRKVIGRVLVEAGILSLPSVEAVEENAILDKMKECVQDLGNKAILNQGYYLDGKDTKEVVAQLRLANPNRIYVFIDSKTRRQHIWKPGRDEPELMTRQDINRLRYEPLAFFYFAPPDGRGTNCVISAGKGKAFISPRITLDEFVQLLGRLRGLGTIHSIDFIISKGIESRIRERQLHFTGLTYPVLVADVNRQDLLSRKGRYLKTGLISHKTILNMGTRHLLDGHNNTYEQPIYWNARSSFLRTFNTLIIEKLRMVANHPDTGWLEERRDVTLENDFHPSFYEPTLNMVRSLYENEIAKLERLGATLTSIEQNPDPLLVELSHLIDNEGKAWLQERKNDLENQVALMKQLITTAFNRVEVRLSDRDNPIYPMRVPSCGSAIPTAQAQVQEIQENQQQQVQQQQQLQQQQQQMQGKILRISQAIIPCHPFASQPLDLLFTKLALPIFRRDNGEMEQFKGFWSSVSGFQTTENFNEVFNVMNGIRGHLSMCRFLVKNNTVCLISRSDYHVLDQPSQAFDGIYSFLSPSLFGIGHVRNEVRRTVDAAGQASPYRREEDETFDPLQHPEVQNQLVLAKWFLGIAEYTPAELLLLRPLLQAIERDASKKTTHQAYLERFGTQEQRTLIKNL